MNYEILSITLGTAAFFIIIVLFSLYKISDGMKKFLNDNLNEVLISSAEYIGENIETLDKTVLDRTQALQQENELLRSEIIEKLDAITMSSSIKDVLQNFKSDIENTFNQLLSKINEIKIYGPISSENPPESFNPDLNTIKDEIKNLVAAVENVNNNFKDQSDIIKKSASYIGQKINHFTEAINSKPNTVTGTSIEINWQELKDILQQTLPEEIVNEILSQDTIKNLDSAIKEFIKTIENNTKIFNKAAKDHETTMANVTGTVQKVLTNGTEDMKNKINETNNALKSIITTSMEQINSNYAENIKSIFQAMADNLAAIKRQLASEAPVIDTQNNTAAKTSPNKKTAGKKEELASLWRDYKAYFKDDEEKAEYIMSRITGKDRSSDYTAEDIKLLRESLDKLKTGQHIEYKVNVA